MSKGFDTLKRDKLSAKPKYFPTPFPGYSVSVSGEVRCGRNPLRRKFWPNGQPYVWVKTAGRTVEVPVEDLVAHVFLGRPPKGVGYMVTHRNGDEADCRAENLAWVEDAEWKFDEYCWLMSVPPHFAPGLPRRR